MEKNTNYQIPKALTSKEEVQKLIDEKGKEILVLKVCSIPDLEFKLDLKIEDPYELGVPVLDPKFGDENMIVYIPAMLGNFLMTEVLKFALATPIERYSKDITAVVVDMSDLSVSKAIVCDTAYMVANTLYDQDSSLTIIAVGPEEKSSHFEKGDKKDKKKKHHKEDREEDSSIKKLSKIWFNN